MTAPLDASIAPSTLSGDRLAVVPAARTEPEGGGANAWTSWLPLCEAVTANLATIPAWDEARAG